MNIEKQVLTKLNRCYSTNHTYIDNDLKILFASEGEDKCLMFSGDKLRNESVVWDIPGGCMGIVFIPNRPTEFYAVQNFFPTFQAENAKLVYGKYINGSWTILDVMPFPFLHRFDVYEVDGVDYFIGCTLASSKQSKDDWSDPGKVYVAKIGSDLSKPLDISVIKDGLVKNHGYTRGIYGGNKASFVGSDSGVLAITPPSTSVGTWSIKKIFNKPVSDMAFVDIDGDGHHEMAIIEEFHGKKFKIFKHNKDGIYDEEIYEYPHERDFGHVVWGGNLRGVPSFIGGFRRPVNDLFYIQLDKTDNHSKFVAKSIDTHGGPSNIDVINQKDKDIISTANRETGEATLYILK